MCPSASATEGQKMVDIAKLSKHDLLLMLRDQELELKQLKEENERLKGELSAAPVKREAAPQELGSLAEESVKVSGVMLAAQKAADEYLNAVKSRYASIEDETARMLDEAQTRCNRIEFEARYKADLAWESVKKKLDDYCLAHAELEGLLGQTQSIINQLK